MKIQKLNITNVMGAKSVEIVADPIINELTGKNGAGKSSILDSICMAIGGKTFVPEKPLHSSEQEGSIILETDTLIFTRRFSGEKQTLKIRGKDRGTFNQTDANNLLGKLTFDPLAFSRAKTQEKIKQLMELVPADVQEQIEKKKQEEEVVSETRTFIHREIQAIGSTEMPPEEERVERVSVSDLMEKLNKLQQENHEAEEHNEGFNLLESEINGVQACIEHNKSEIAAYEEQIKKLRESISASEEKLKDMEKRRKDWKNIPVKDDEVLDLKRQLAEVDEINRKADAWDAAIKKAEKKAQKEAEYEEHTKEIQRLRKERVDLFSSVKFPFEGLVVEDGNILVNDVPFEQLSSGEKIRVSTMFAMSANPELKIMIIRDGSLLDDEGYNMVIGLAEEKGYQVWMETVGEGHNEQALIIEEGVCKS